MDFREPKKTTSRRSIGNLDGSSYGTGGTDSVRIQPGTGDFLTPVPIVTDSGYVKSANQAVLDLKIQNVGSGAGVFARRERDGVTYSFRRLLGGDNVSINEVGDSILITALTGVDRFINLKDVPNSFSGQDGKVLVVDETNSRLIFADLPAMPEIPDFPDEFLELNDTPASYAGQDGKILVVDEDNQRIMFVDMPEPPEVVTNFLALTDTPNDYNGHNGKFLTVDESTGSIAFTNLNLEFPDVPSRITFGPIPPVNPEPIQGDGWWNTTDGSFFLYYEDVDSGQWVESGSSEPAMVPQVRMAYDYGAYYDGQPGPLETVYRWRAPRAHRLSENFEGCLFTCGTNPSVDFVCSVWVNGTQVGTWTINPAGAATMVSTQSGYIDIPANQEVKIVAPEQTDGTLTDLVISFKGERY